MNEHFPHDTSDESTDDALAEAIADAILNLAKEPGSHRLTAMQMAGMADDPPTLEDIAKAYGFTSVRQLHRLERCACMRIAHLHPELRQEIEAFADRVYSGKEAERYSAE